MMLVNNAPSHGSQDGWMKGKREREKERESYGVDYQERGQR